MADAVESTAVESTAVAAVQETGRLLLRLESTVHALASAARAASEAASVAELQRVWEACIAARTAYARAAQPVIGIAGITALDPASAGGLRVLNAWLAPAAAAAPAMHPDVTVEHTRRTHTLHAPSAPPLDEAAWIALFADAPAPAATPDPAHRTNDGVFPWGPGVHARMVVHVRHAAVHSITVRFRATGDVARLVHAQRERARVAGVHAAVRLPSTLRASFPIRGYAVERWTFACASYTPDEGGAAALQRAMAAWLHQHAFGPDALWQLVETIRIELPAEILAAGAQLMVLPSGPDSASEQLLTVPAMGTLAGTIVCVGQPALEPCAVASALELSGAACGLAGADAAFPVAILTDRSGGLQLELLATNPFVTAPLDAAGPLQVLQPPSGPLHPVRQSNASDLGGNSSTSSTPMVGAADRARAVSVIGAMQKRALATVLNVIHVRVIPPLLRLAYHVGAIETFHSTLVAPSTEGAAAVARSIQTSLRDPQSRLFRIIATSTCDLYSATMRPVFAKLLAAGVASAISAVPSVVSAQTALSSREGVAHTMTCATVQLVPVTLRVLAALRDFLVPPLATLQAAAKDSATRPRGAVPSGDSTRKRKAAPADSDGADLAGPEDERGAFAGLPSMVVTAVSRVLHRSSGGLDAATVTAATERNTRGVRILSEMRKDTYGLVLERAHLQVTHDLGVIAAVLPVMTSRLVQERLKELEALPLPIAPEAYIHDVVNTAGRAICQGVLDDLDRLVPALVTRTLLPAIGDAIGRYHAQLFAPRRTMSAEYQSWCARVANTRRTIADERDSLLLLLGQLTGSSD